jgi:ABC-type molybdenum transport system ATPase subunit/photorepair protein PhrA
MVPEKSFGDIRRKLGGGSTGLIYITHHQEELIHCINLVLKLDKVGQEVISCVTGP